MRFNESNFFTHVKNVVTGKNEAKGSADGGIRIDVPITITDITTTTAFPAITDSTTGTASTTFGAIGGATYATDAPAIKNALAQIAKQFNALALANGTINTGKTPAFVIASGTNPAIGVVSYPIPRDYDEASDNMLVRVKVALANADAAITLTGIPTATPLGKAGVTGSLVSATLPFKTTAANLSTTEQVVEVKLSGLGLTRDGLISVTLAIAGTTTGAANITGIEFSYDSTIVSYNDTDNAIGTGNPLR